MSIIDIAAIIKEVANQTPGRIVVTKFAQEVAEKAIEADRLVRPNPAIAAIQFAIDINTTDGLVFLDAWMQGDFEGIRTGWPDAPAEVFVGAEIQA